ncbi:MAG: NrpR regulatory domain-containing protein [Dehalococcoidia bacterium]|nr:NrpR regulatory domain-containing protein [Dehalococcoidia bacterium]
MIGTETQEVERKVLAILRIVSESQEPVGARIVARRLCDYGIDLTERGVRYHLKLTDERGLTRLVGRDGRLVTDHGREEIASALVRDKVGLALSRIEMRAFQTSFDLKSRSGLVPVNVSLFPKEKFSKALAAMTPAFRAGLCAGDRVVVVSEGERLGDMVIPAGKIGFGTICSVLINGVLLKSGIPMDSRFGGILQIRNRLPLRFVELVHYAGSSLDPSEIFIRGKMTSVGQAAKQGNGKILANFREIPAVCRPIVEKAIAGLKEAGLHGVLMMGTTSESVCETPVDLNKVGMILIGGMNPIAAAEEVGIQADNKAMSAVVDYKALTVFEELLK